MEEDCVGNRGAQRTVVLEKGKAEEEGKKKKRKKGGNPKTGLTTAGTLNLYTTVAELACSVAIVSFW
jgi:hypothetical protein